MALTRDEAQEQKDLAALQKADEAAQAEANRALSVPESLTALRDHLRAVQVQLARGSKSDLDAVGTRLHEAITWVEALLDDKRDNPRSVSHALQPSTK